MDEGNPGPDLPTADWVAACRQAAERLRHLSQETFELERMAVVVQACGFDLTPPPEEAAV